LPAPGNGALRYAASSRARAQGSESTSSGREEHIRTRLRNWIAEHSKLQPLDDWNDQTPILDRGLLSSLDVVEFVLFIEELRGEEIASDDIEPEVFSNVDTLWEAFFAAE
jgi:acyl carrier protein